MDRLRSKGAELQGSHGKLGRAGAAAQASQLISRPLRFHLRGDLPPSVGRVLASQALAVPQVWMESVLT